MKLNASLQNDKNHDQIQMAFIAQADEELVLIWSYDYGGPNGKLMYWIAIPKEQSYIKE